MVKKIGFLTIFAFLKTFNHFCLSAKRLNDKQTPKSMVNKDDIKKLIARHYSNPQIKQISKIFF